ncbi:MAG TPA: hypothetical protein GXZ52_02550 [Clostridiales bacterium]|jgi:two-component system phosphate regulon sensor histidine kinase PhoR|nr:hypothetical protein [Clostridiales bacterium]
MLPAGSHELKTPLTSISGFAEIMKNGLVKPEDVPEIAGDIYDEAQRLIALIEDIIRLSRLDENSLPLEMEPVDLLAMAEEVARRLKPAALQKGVSLVTRGEHLEITGARQILDEMIFNLCENAVKYNRENGKVTITVQPMENEVRLIVEDTGIGIPLAHQDRVFECFYRVDKSHSREMGGTGLGLSIVKHGAAYHGASLALESKVGQGTKITLSFKRK